MISRSLVALALTLLLAACGSSFKTSYTQIEASQAAALRVTSIDVDVPASLQVSESNALVPSGDIVWRGEPAGDRRAQVAAIVKEAARRGTVDLKGRSPARLAIQVERFHALTPRARALSGNVGVLGITFVAQLFDAKTGAPLTEPQRIVADAPALVGNAAKAADARGYTQKVEVTEHLTKVFRNWLGGRGEDPRSKFTRSGA